MHGHLKNAAVGLTPNRYLWLTVKPLSNKQNKNAMNIKMDFGKATAPPLHTIPPRKQQKRD